MCQYGMLAVAGETANVDAFIAYLEAQYPSLLSPPAFLPAGYAMVKKFPSEGDVEDYVKSSSYSDSQQVAMSLIIPSEQGSYTLRPNSTYFPNQVRKTVCLVCSGLPRFFRRPFGIRR